MPNTTDELYKKHLLEASIDLKVSVTEHMLDQALNFLKLLHKWNGAYNFTAIDSVSKMIDRHWQDSLTIAPFITTDSVLDVGTGPGLPGIPLSIVFPEKSFCLLDSNEKRQFFLQQVIHQIKLSNVALHCGRVELYQVEKKFQCIMSRAFKPLPEMLQMTKHLLEDGGVVLAMKGRINDNEMSEMDRDFTVERIIPLQHPGLPERNLVVLAFKKVV